MCRRVALRFHGFFVSFYFPRMQRYLLSIPGVLGGYQKKKKREVAEEMMTGGSHGVRLWFVDVWFSANSNNRRFLCMTTAADLKNLRSVINSYHWKCRFPHPPGPFWEPPVLLIMWVQVSQEVYSIKTSIVFFFFFFFSFFIQFCHKFMNYMTSKMKAQIKHPF